jgi:ATP-dependent Clp protease protease subunit
MFTTIGRKRRGSELILRKSKKRRLEDSEDESDEEIELPFNPFAISKDDNDVFILENHIYFTTDVSMKSINKLTKIIFAANREFDLLKQTCKFAEVTPKPIYLHITSTGGDLFAGLRGIDVIQRSELPIYTIIEGYAISAGSVLFLSGKKRFMSKNSYLLIHQLSSYDSGGTFEQIKDSIKNDAMLMNRLYDFYIKSSRNNKLTLDIIKEVLKHDIYWNYKTCEKYGLVDGIYNEINKTIDNNNITPNLDKELEDEIDIEKIMKEREEFDNLSNSSNDTSNDTKNKKKTVKNKKENSIDTINAEKIEKIIETIVKAPPKRNPKKKTKYF